MAVLATLGMVACVALPGLANSRPRSERVICANNLRQIGQAYQTWAADHQDMNPWWVPVSSGGVRGHPLDSYAWFQFSWVSNQLGTPKILTCPADPFALTARDWTTDPNGGFSHLNYRNNALSYFLGLHALQDYPWSLLAGDRNLRVNAMISTCSSGIKGSSAILPPAKGWTADLHVNAGNLLLSSGEVLQVSTPGVQAAVTNALPPIGFQVHALYPQVPFM